MSQTRTFLEYNEIDIVDARQADSRSAVCIKDPDDNMIELSYYQAGRNS